MARFGRVLRRAETELRVTSARRTRVLQEVGQDLEDAYAEYRSRGLDAAEAARRAEALLAPSGEALAELRRLHGSAYARLLDRFTTPGAHRLERALLAGLTSLAVVVGAVGIAAAGGPRTDSPVVWVLLALAAVAAGLAVGDRLADLRGAPRPTRDPFGLAVAIGLAAVLVAALGAMLELWRLPASLAAAPPTAAIAAAAAGAAEQLALGLIVALFALLAGFHVRSRRRAAALKRARIPGLGNPSTEENDS